MSTETSLVAAKRFVELYNQGTADWVEATHHPESQWREMPSPLAPEGRSGNRSVLRAAAEGAIGGLPDRKISTLNMVATDDQVAIQSVWTGTVAIDGMAMPKGTRLTMDIAFFLKFQDGLIISQTDYVCLNPIDE